MSVRWLWLVGLLLSGPTSVSALTCTAVSGFSDFSCVVDSINKTITLVETITEETGIISLTFDCTSPVPNDCLIDDVPAIPQPWQVTKTVTNSTSSNWLNLDNELMVGCNTNCDGVLGGGTCDLGNNGTAFYCHSNDFDGTHFDQGNVDRTVDSDVFSTVRVDEEVNRDFLQFDNCSPTGTTHKVINSTFTCVVDASSDTYCCTVGTGSSNLVNIGSSDVETFPVVSVAIENVQLVQTPNLGFGVNACYNIATITANFEDISGTGTLITASSANLALPFSFAMYNKIYSTVRWNAGPIMNGFLSFTAVNTSGDNVNILTTQAPTASVDIPMIIPLWDQWLSTSFCAEAGSTSSTYHQTLGTFPTRRLVIQWDKVCPLAFDCDTGATSVTFQTKLFEADGHMEFHYSDTDTNGVDDSDCITSSTNGAMATVGVRDTNAEQTCTTPPAPNNCQFGCDTEGVPAGCGRATQYSFNQAIIPSNFALSITIGSCVTDDWGWTHRL